MKIAVITFLALITSCNQNVSSPPTNSTAVHSSPRSSEAQRLSRLYALPKVQSFSKQTIERFSDIRDENAMFVPPFKWIRFVPRFEQKPKVGDTLTLIPVGVNIPSIGLKILEVNPYPFPIKRPVYRYPWEAELEPITQKEFFEYNKDESLPFDVFWIYPSVEFALQISKDDLTEGMLPKGVNRTTVTAAIDLTNDKNPDLLIVQYCIDPPTAESLYPPTCRRSCFKKYMKSEGKWEQVENFWPC